MPKFHKTDHHEDHHTGRILSKEELDAKHAAALEAKAIISWKSPERIFKARSKKYFTKVALYGLIFVLAAIAFGEFFLVGVIIAVVFVVYVLATVAPHVIEHKITNMGIISGGRAFLWEELDSFWFDKRGDDRLLVVATNLHFPTRLIILLTTVSERTLLDILEKHIHFHHGPVHTLFDKWANSLQKRINLE
ncbi:hypothetical protein A2697_05265 [Candidatus Curtissbacteria bacterium RIFCSPHIGHO2_01_FULL_41_44]|uniref:DUF5673 domain-containing protein n=1 Tax=Candidatus Curtissbacteria bacterium RIFCSPLOWO2_01_FULL_42_50 TaxID=1797730 RepID=A0A1F5H3D8_9BACT|nr:MAG: hypothetical protein A2697_05265 [Candidatus Curtissbacteria bacterium RIFCSPHIGHO2_01_FULL_41_44]OGD93132.1 MAG: hypothetical protein A3C33_05015 [Candidatus Curtissbacteria bacterium RIFCSPHIGHO2_02_FULL_42_58]OGD96794.1 MAG: hypothetical protein A3E71_01460 [Candidatus Curtissbacteria bacterium RIFCSPHIGHO2_12_FULL_42_33]OGD98653.1 MAG: hypothetical protein A3B54_02740 [Candidatus Curtissbacteria bacterium RIFCSPLOWO2_01_FULL_42_50]OGE02586.1 MAG: hypothetical protein A3G16_03610 [Ca